MKFLNEKEAEKFTKKYLPDWIGDINEVSMIKYKYTKEYLVNEHYLIIIRPFKRLELDFYEL